MTPQEARQRFVEARIAHLATSDQAGVPHLVPFVFALAGNTLVSAVDHKPKRSTALRRLENIAENPSVAALVDSYDDDWSRLWWARADGVARLLDPGSCEAHSALEHLVARYDQYRDRPPEGPVIAIDVHCWSGWEAASGVP